MCLGFFMGVNDMAISYGTTETANANYSSGLQPETPRTIASAASRIDGLSDRLVKMRAQLEVLSEVIGGPRPANGIGGAKDRPPSGVVQRLNDGAENAHGILDDIEGLLSGISRALG